jgi:hypothetical protein
MKHHPPKMPRLKSLVLDNFRDTWVGANDLQKWTDLSHLSVTTLEIRNNSIPRQMILPKTLTSLSLCNFRDSGRRALVLGLYHLPNLEHLRLRNVLDFITLDRVPENTPIISTKLRTLSVINCALDCFIYRNIALACPNLESVELTTVGSLFVNHFVQDMSYSRIDLHTRNDEDWEGFVLGLSAIQNPLFLYDEDQFGQDNSVRERWKIRRVDASDVAVGHGTCIGQKGTAWFELLKLDGKAWSRRVGRNETGGDRAWVVESISEGGDTVETDGYWSLDEDFEE